MKTVAIADTSADTSGSNNKSGCGLLNLRRCEVLIDEHLKSLLRTVLCPIEVSLSQLI